MAQYIYTMNNVSKLVPPKREILKNINLSYTSNIVLNQSSSYIDA